MEGGYRLGYVALGVCVGICRSWNERGQLVGGISRWTGFVEVYSIGVLEVVSTMVRLVLEVGALSGGLLALVEWLWWQGAGKRRGEMRRRAKRGVEGVLIGGILLGSSGVLVKNLVSWIGQIGEAEGCRIESLMTLERALELIEGVGLGLLLMYVVLMWEGMSRRKRYGLIGVISLLVTPPEVEHLLELMGLMVLLVELREWRSKKERNNVRWHKWI